MRWLYVAYVSWCKSRNIQPTQHQFTVAFLGKSKKKAYPVLSSEVKAVHCKYMVYFLAHVCVAFDGATLEDRLQTTCVCSLAECFQLFDSNGRYLSDFAATRAFESGNLFASCYVRLARDALRRREALWKIRPKMHDWQEILVRVMYDKVNPVFYGCLNDESMLCLFKVVTKACHRNSANTRVALRYLGQLMLAFEGRA